MKKLIASILLLACYALLAGPAYDIRSIFTEEGYNAAVQANNAVSDKEPGKAFYTEYLNLGPALRGVDFSTVSYAELKERTKDIGKSAFDGFIFMECRDNAAVVTAYLKDSDFDSPRNYRRKFNFLAGYLPEATFKEVEPAAIFAVVIKALEEYDATKLNEAYTNALITCMNAYMKKADAVSADEALTALKALKRAAYKNIKVSDTWKNVLVDVELKIQALQ